MALQYYPALFLLPSLLCNIPFLYYFHNTHILLDILCFIFSYVCFLLHFLDVLNVCISNLTSVYCK